MLLAVESLRIVAVTVGAGVAVLLQFKPELHHAAQRLGDEDLRAIMQFVLITCVVLPVLPNRTFDPLERPQPLQDLADRGVYRGVEPGRLYHLQVLRTQRRDHPGRHPGRRISSTATTLSYSRQVRRDPSAIAAVAIVIMIATTVSFVRVLLAVAVVLREFFRGWRCRSRC